MTFACVFCKKPMTVISQEAQAEAMMCNTIYHCDQCHVGLSFNWYIYELDEEEETEAEA